MHDEGWGHCDFKPKQVRVTLGPDGTTIDKYKLVDAGSWTPFSGTSTCKLPTVHPSLWLLHLPSLAQDYLWCVVPQQASKRPQQHYQLVPQGSCSNDGVQVPALSGQQTWLLPCHTPRQR